MLSRILVFGDQGGGVPSSVVLELVSAARGLGEQVDVALCGPQAADCAGMVGAHGARRLFDLGDPGDAFAAPRAAAALAALAAPGGPAGSEPFDAVLCASTTLGRDVAGRLSVRLDRPVLANVVGLSLDGGSLRSEHLVFGGTTALTAGFSAPGPGIFLVRAKSFAAEAVGGSPAEVVAVESPELGGSDAARVLERRASDTSGPSLEEAAVVVSGGRGLGGADNYALVERLAGLLKGAPAATRAIVDAGWVPYAHQVGQTGKTVKPELYLAFGISGATQHLVGMRHARHIVAVNRDPSAPIFEVADLGVVGDAPDLLKRLIAALGTR